MPGAADAEIGKPSAGPGKLGCNASYAANIGVRPVPADLATADPAEVCSAMGPAAVAPAVLTACPPCTGFSRTMASNHLRDDARNGLVGQVGEYAALLRPDIVLVENARELVMGRFAAHLANLAGRLARLGYQVEAGTYFFDRFGLPQRRERAVIVAVRRPLAQRGLSALWDGLAGGRESHPRPPGDLGPARGAGGPGGSGRSPARLPGVPLGREPQSPGSGAS